MKKVFLPIFLIVLLLPGLSAAQGYVRKNIEPDFFIPAGDKLNRPEKLPPIYKDGKNITNRKQDNVIETPEYQQKYEQYQQDLESIAKIGEITPNQGLNEALEKMNGNEVFEVKETPLQNSEVKIRFEKALENTLNEN